MGGERQLVVAAVAHSQDIRVRDDHDSQAYKVTVLQSTYRLLKIVSRNEQE